MDRGCGTQQACISPARQGAAEAPSSVSTELTPDLHAVQQDTDTSFLRASLGISDIVQHGALQVLPSEKMQTGGKQVQPVELQSTKRGT